MLNCFHERHYIMKKPNKVKTRQRYRLNLEYAGTGFSGWQKQANARTIQGTLLEVASEIFRDPKLDIQGNGRTDAGVHALNYTAHLQTSAGGMEPEKICDRFNNLLPSSIVMLSVTPSEARFHARHNCVGRSYVYQISTRKSVFQKNYAWWPKEQLNTTAMFKAAELFVGMHDFASFAEKPELKKSTKVLVNGVYIYEEKDMLRLRIVGSHFLWKMVRRMAGVLVEVGRGNLSAAKIAGFLEGTVGKAAEFTAPASGLFFEKAFYDKDEFNKFLDEASGETDFT